jgi:hypothetical protein
MANNKADPLRYLATMLLLLTPFAIGCRDRNAIKAATATAASYPTPDESGVVLWTGQDAGNRKVENGDAYDKAIIDVGEQSTVVVPHNARIEHNGARGRIEVYLHKVQSYGGRPPERKSIRDTRTKMGCAKMLIAEKIIIATYGESSSFEGGASIPGLLIRVPADVKVESRKDLSGPSRVLGDDDAYHTIRERVVPGEQGWEALFEEPDLKATARAVDAQ